MDQDITISIGDLFKFILRGLLLALVVGAAAAAVTFQLSRSREAVYQAQATVVAAQTNPDSGLGVPRVSAPPLDASAYQAATRSDSVLAPAIQRMGVSEPSPNDIRRLRSRISVLFEEDRTSSLIFITAEGASPDLAAQRANAVADALVDWDTRRASLRTSRSIATLQETILGLTDQIRSLQLQNDAALRDQINGLITLRADYQQRLNTAQALSSSAIGLLEVLQPAIPSNRPVSPRPTFSAVVAFIVGVFLSYLALLIRRALDTRIRDSEDLARVAGSPVLAEYPKIQRSDRAQLREASSYLRTNLLFSTADAHPKIFLVTSPQSGDGKTSMSLSLAEGFVRNGYRTLLVDADLRAPSIAKEYKINPLNQSSLNDWLQDPFGKHQPVGIAVTPKQKLYVVPVFQAVAQASEMLTINFRNCLATWQQEYDVIIVDSAPLLAVADALTIAPFCTGTVLAVNQARTDRRQLRTAIDLLKRLGVRVLGVVATHVSGENKRVMRYGYGYADPGIDEVVESKRIRPKTR